jgi:flagellar basal body-associated protein FliL
MLKLYRLEGAELDELFRIMDETDSEQRQQIRLIMIGQDLFYYKNIKEISGPTLDETPIFYTVTLNYGYERGNKKLQTLINQNKPVITDITRQFFSSMTEEQIMSGDEFMLKFILMIRLNKALLLYDPAGKFLGIEDIAILQLQTFDLQ